MSSTRVQHTCPLSSEHDLLPRQVDTIINQNKTSIHVLDSLFADDTDCLNNKCVPEEEQDSADEMCRSITIEYILIV